MTYDTSFLEQSRTELEQRRDAIIQRNREKLAELFKDFAERRGDSIDITTAEQTESTELLFQNRLKTMLHEIERSLEKLDNEDYGECEECGEPIGEGRLRILPTALYCVECKEGLETTAKRRYKRPGLMDEFTQE